MRRIRLLSLVLAFCMALGMIAAPAYADGTTMTITLVIPKKTPAASDFTYTAPSNLVYSDSNKAATVTAKSGVNGMGTITVKYYSNASRTTEATPKNVNTYYVGVTVAEGDQYAASTSVIYGDGWTFAITPSTPGAPAAPTKASATKNSITLNAVSGCEYSKDGTTYQDSTQFTGLAPGTEYTFYQRVKATTNTNASPASSAKFSTTADTYAMTITLVIKPAQTITAENVTATYGETNKSVSATTSGNGAISYAIKEGSGDYIAVNASTGALTIKKVPPTDGKAYVIVTAEATSDYAAATKEVTVTISKAANPATVTNTATVLKGGNTVDLAGNVTKNGATGDVSYDISGEANGCSLNGSVLTSGDSTGNVAVNVTIAADDNYNALAATPITVTINSAAHSVTITPGSNMTKTTDSGAAEQPNVSGAMTDVVYTADEGYYFPEGYSVEAVNGISVTRNSYMQITVSGTPTDDAEITLTAPTAKTKPDAPTTAAATDCTTADNNDGKLTGVTTEMEYKKSDAEEWTAGTGSEITGLVPGTYYVRVKATDTTLASDNQELTIRGFISYTVTFKVVNGSWDDGEGDAATADKTVILTGHDGDSLKLTADQIPTVGTKPNDTYKAGSWDVTPSTETEITAATTYTYTYAQKDSISQTVTFKVVNGSWDDGNSADITVTLTGLEGDTLKLAENQIPAVGTKPADTFKEGAWDVVPSTETAITAATTYTYTYAAKDGISQTVTFKVVNGSWDNGNSADITVTLSGLEGDTLKLTADQIPAVGTKPADTFKAGAWDVVPSTETAITAATTYTYTYAAKDSISQTVTFKVVNGSWDDGNSADVTVTLTGLEGDTLKLAANQIPAVGGKPNVGFEAGKWDVTPDTNTEIKETVTYTYTYAASQTPVVYTDESEPNQNHRLHEGNLIFTFKRNLDDQKTFSLFDKALVDNRELTLDVDYTKASGSLILTLKADYLDTLALGEHTLTVLFTDGRVDSRFTVSRALDPTNFDDVAVESDSFSFKVVWQGGSDKSIDFTLYKKDGTVYRHGFDKQKLGSGEWKYSAWFSAPEACYVLETPMAGYQIRYENVGVYAQVTDRCCDGGTITIHKVPKTGDTANLALWMSMVVIGALTLCGVAVLGKRRKQSEK